MNLLSLFVAFVVLIVASAEAKSVSKCSEAEHAQIQETHLECTKQVEERYAILAGKFESRLPSPVAAAAGRANSTNERDPDILQICNLIHDVVEKCGQLYHKCLEEDQYRQFLDAQLEVFIQLMTRLYNLGAEVHQCEAVLEYERSGRREIVQSTEKCKGDDVQKLTIKYQQCIEDANIDMTRRMMGHHDDHEMAFQSLCSGIDEVVHGCSEMLINCYTKEQIDETKTGQLEMTKKVFRDIMEDPRDAAAQKESAWKYDVSECSAFKNSAVGITFKLTDLLMIYFTGLILYNLSL